MSVRTENAAKAKAWVASIKKSDRFKEYVNKSVKDTEVRFGDQIYSNYIASYIEEKLKSTDHEGEIVLSSNTTGDELFSLQGKGDKVAVLNFASYFNPGGGFLKGAIAQEESLCHISGLYNVLCELEIYTARSAKEKVAPEYEDEIIYSPGVPFSQDYKVDGDIVLADVLSCSAPNCNRVPIAQIEQYKKAIEKRVLGIYTEPYLHGCSTLILGAWGCGVFKNDPVLIASAFKEMNERFSSLYKKVIYAIPNVQIYRVFENVFTS